MATSTDNSSGDGSAATLVFVVGTGRCGSTLVHEVLARHASVGFVSNLDDRLPLSPGASRWNQTLYRRLPPALTQKGRLRYAPSEAYRLLDREVSPMLSTPTRDLLASDATPWLASQLRTCFETRMHAQRKPVFLHKFTGWPRIGLLREVFPDATYIHIVRDGRAVVNSWLQMPWWLGYRGPEQWGFGPLSDEQQAEYDASGRSFVVLAAIAWKMLMAAFADAWAALPPERYTELRYEDVVADPKRSFAAMLDASGLSHTAQFSAALARYEFRVGRTEAFRQDLSPADLDALTESLSAVLTANGYT